MNDISGPLIVLGIIALFAILRRQFWLFLSMLAGNLIGLLLGWDLRDDILGVLLIVALIYFVGKFIGNAITKAGRKN